EEESLQILKSQVKSREQAIELYEKGNRLDLSEIEKKEIEIIKEYLPKPLSEEELTSEVILAIEKIQANSMKDMGKVMKILSQKLGSRADGRLLSNIVKEKLSS
ncbi:MAG: GatB/YqeY domain-containing protein, partial [Candidatus Cloacimonetes bacterium]|nr:GatB/YqeY domain-containing protein [Candidatus Cloacimonadota bacterium]